MNIAQEIYESIQELYQEIIKVDLKTGKATILHSITDPSDRGKECIWDSQLEKYMKNKIQPSDHERMRDNFCLRHLRNECEKGKGLFSNNFSTMNGKLPDNHVTVLAFAPGNDSQEKVYILLRKAGQEYFMWSIANQYVSSTCDYFIYLHLTHHHLLIFLHHIFPHVFDLGSFVIIAYHRRKRGSRPAAEHLVAVMLRVQINKIIAGL